MSTAQLEQDEFLICNNSVSVLFRSVTVIVILDAANNTKKMLNNSEI